MTEDNKPVKQHYVPKFYLRGFTESGKETDYLYVIEQETGKQYKSRPSELAVQKDGDALRFVKKQTLTPTEYLTIRELVNQQNAYAWQHISTKND